MQALRQKKEKIFLRQPKKVLTDVMSVNLKGAYFLTQKVANWMIDQKKNDNEFNGCIINISSISATVASVNRGEYCISKAGIEYGYTIVCCKAWANLIFLFLK